MKIEKTLINQIVLPKANSRKGDNGRVLVVGGSKLFHAAAYWSAASASKIVDMVHFSSLYLLNNELMEKRVKDNFWSGIVVPWSDLNHYIEEDDAILIGPGMERGEETRRVVNELLRKYPEKKWVVDGGALQEVDPSILTKHMIITPNLKEWEILESKGGVGVDQVATIIRKGVVDEVIGDGQSYLIEGGVSGMTKGGTGDVLSGIVVGLYAKSSAVTSCYVASLVNKRIGEKLSRIKGSFFDAGEMVSCVGEELFLTLN